MSINILTWHKPSNSGAFQKMTELGIFSDAWNEKPKFSFEYENLEYVEQASIFTVDGDPMTDEQKKEILARIESVAVPNDWFKIMKKQPYLEYLSHTDWYVTRKIETGKEIPTDVIAKRDEAREAIGKIESE